MKKSLNNYQQSCVEHCFVFEDMSILKRCGSLLRIRSLVVWNNSQSHTRCLESIFNLMGAFTAVNGAQLLNSSPSGANLVSRLIQLDDYLVWASYNNAIQIKFIMIARSHRNVNLRQNGSARYEPNYYYFS